jgi:tRNA A37 threonylcarbamoyltransferase TsaD
VTECRFATANAIMIRATGMTTIAVRIFRSKVDPAQNERIRQVQPD